jgi:predicted nucleic acid-binding protein
MLVLDASAALAWIFQRQSSHEAMLAERVLDDLERVTVRVPALWQLEVANALLVAERRGVVSETQVSTFLQRLSQLPIQTDPTPTATRQEGIVYLGRRLGLSAYDAAYLDLALRSGSALATFDQKLAAASRAVDVEIYGADR